MRLLVGLLASCTAFMTVALADDPGAPKLDDMVWQTAGSVCQVWRDGKSRGDPAAASLVLISFPGGEKPFGLRALTGIDGALFELHQIAYLRTGDRLSIHYRTQGYRNYDVRLDLGNLAPGRLEGDDLTGTITTSRFGLFSQMAIRGRCGVSQN
jgi:hypothetical protein